MKMQWKIGNVEIPNPFVLAPMAGVTDLAFRRLCKEQGAGLICMEMVSAKAISFHNKNTEALMEIDPGEHPVSMQLFGSEPDLMAEVAKSIEERTFDILDINMGCPVPKVVNNGEGSALLKDPQLIEEIVRSVSGAVSKPVTVKVRIGFDENLPKTCGLMERVYIIPELQGKGYGLQLFGYCAHEMRYGGLTELAMAKAHTPEEEAIAERFVFHNMNGLPEYLELALFSPTITCHLMA